MKVITAFTSIFSSLLLAACSQTEIENKTTGNLSGVVSDMTTGEPVSVVNLSLEPGGYSTVTGSDGSFSFKNLTAGEYKLSLNKDGYENNTTSVTIDAGKDKLLSLLIKKIPATITIDRNSLSFGEGDVNSLSFNIINSGYEDLDWEIEYDCEWISQIKDNKGTLAYGRTQTIVVFINRDFLAPGYNETSIVVKTSNGSSDLKVTVVGEDRDDVVLSLLEVDNITSNSATFHAKIINPGLPRYTSRGFVYATDPDPSIASSIKVLTAPLSEDMTFTSSATDLNLNYTYYVKAFAKSDLGTFYSSNQIEFTPHISMPVISIQETSNINISEVSITLNGTIEYIGDPPYVEKGFVYNTVKNPTIYNNKIIAVGNNSGLYSASLSNLSLDQLYYARAYAISGDKKTVVYSNTEVEFKISIIPPEITMDPVTNINTEDASAIFSATIVYNGDPEYSERGFVYASKPEPSIYDFKIINESSEINKYSNIIKDLEYDTKYYVKGYAFNGEYIYSENTSEFIISSTNPEIETLPVTDINVNGDIYSGQAILHAKVIEPGCPQYSKKGFVYSINPNPDINDDVIFVDNNDSQYSIKINNLNVQTTYYVRGFVQNELGITYGNIVSFTPESNDYAILNGLNILVARNDISNSTITYDNAAKLCKNLSISGYSDWRLPTTNELLIIYNNQDSIGSFKSTSYTSSYPNYPFYWSDELSEEKRYVEDKETHSWYYGVNFNSGQITEGVGDITATGYNFSSSKYYILKHYGRCVRTLTDTE